MLRVQEYIANHTVDSFQNDYKTVDAVIRNLEIMGEAPKNLSFTLRANYPEIPWKEMYRMRNRVSHDYFGIDYLIIWRIITDYLPENLEQITTILKNER